MIYHSNLTAPNIQQYFTQTVCREMPHSQGHDVISEQFPPEVPEIYNNCGFLTHDEAAILFAIAQQIGGHWVDIGSHTGWTAAHLALAGCMVIGVDYMYGLDPFRERAMENLARADLRVDIETYSRRADVLLRSETSQHFWGNIENAFYGVLIDGDHNPPVPLEDAIGAFEHLVPRGVIVFHDFIGGPVQDGARYLIDKGMRFRVYYTPHMMCVCWGGEFEPPHHERDPRIDWARLLGSMKDFPLEAQS